MTPATLTAPGARVETGERPVRITVMVIDDGDAQKPVKVTGPLRSAVRKVFSHPDLAGSFSALRMDADRMFDRVTARWAEPSHRDEARQAWVKRVDSTIVHWWVDRDDVLSTEAEHELHLLEEQGAPVDEVRRGIAQYGASAASRIVAYLARSLRQQGRDNLAREYDRLAGVLAH